MLAAIGKRKSRPLLRLSGDKVPSVDILITCCGEDPDIILDTVKSACTLDYPKDRYRVVLCDDGASPELEKALAKFRVWQPRLFYTTRTSRSEAWAKAKNLNHGRHFVGKLLGGPSEYLAALDVDMIPESHWLRALIPHMLLDPKLALVNPPQVFYNIPKGDPLFQSIAVFYKIWEVIKDRTGSAWCTGSGYVARASAIDDIGGIPTESISEDLLLSNLLLAAGWHTAYIPETLQYGLVPNTYSGHIRQRNRWTLGIINLLSNMQGSRLRTLTRHQQFSSTAPIVRFGLFTAIVAISLLAMPFTLFSGKPLIIYSTPQELRTLLRSAFLFFATTWLHSFFKSRAAGYRIRILPSLGQAWMLPCQSLLHPMVVHVLLIFCVDQVTAIISSISSVLIGTRSWMNLPDTSVQGSLCHRVKVVLWDFRAIVHLVFLVLCIGGLLESVHRVLQAPHDNAQDRVIDWLVHAGWPPALVIFLAGISQAWVPISYALSPALHQTRETLLTRDPVTQIASPSREARKLNATLHQHFNTPYSVLIVMAYFTIVCIGSWFW